MTYAARYFDGFSANPRDVVLSFGTASLAISDAQDGRNVDTWPLSDLRALPGRVKDTSYSLARLQGDARIECADPVLYADLRRVTRRLVRGPARRRGIGKVALLAGTAVAALGIMIFGLIPLLAEGLVDQIAPQTEIAMGDQVRGRLADISPLLMDEPAQSCVSPEGRVALDVMVARVQAGLDLPYPLRVEVWDVDMVNAIALPGGRIIFFEGLIVAADSAEEVAGVLAHELGHVANRDGLRLSLRAAGSAGLLGLIVGDASGGAAAVIAAEQLLNASYTREAEAAADVFALDLLDRADVDVAAFAGFFERISADMEAPNGAMAHFATHPDLDQRAADAHAHGNTNSPRPILTAQGWDDLRAICAQTAPL